MIAGAALTSEEGRLSNGLAAAFPDLDPAAPDYDYLISATSGLVPFGDLVGVEVTEMSADHAVVSVGPDPAVTNHMGTVHAGTLFTAADIAGALAFIGAAATHLHAIERLVLRAATVTYRRPATGRIRAVARVDERELRAVLDAAEAGPHDITCRAAVLDDEDTVTARLTFDYVCNVTGRSGGESR